MLFISNKYHKWYCSLISSAKNRTLSKNIYTEKHHIIPRSLGGDDCTDNLVILTAREHFICHILLTKFTQGQERGKMINAVIFMKSSNTGQFRYLNSRLYEAVRTEYSKQQSIKMKGEGNPFYKKKHTLHFKEKMSKTKKGKLPWNAGLAGSQKTKDIGKTISQVKKGIPMWTNGIQDKYSKQCPGEGWYRGRRPNPNLKHTDNQRQLMKKICSEGKMNWWNNGKINKRCVKCPGKEWKRGRIMSASLYEKFCKKN